MSDAVVDTSPQEEPTRRDFIYIATGVFGGVGGAMLAWPFVAQMLPAPDTMALSSQEVDVSRIPEGEEIRVLIGGKPFFVRHRTAAEIEEARAVDVADLRDPQTDDERLVPGLDGELRPADFGDVGQLYAPWLRAFWPWHRHGRIWRLVLPLPRFAL